MCFAARQASPPAPRWSPRGAGGRRGLAVRAWHGQLQPAGELPAVPGADGASGTTVSGHRQHDAHCRIGGWTDRYLPPDVLAAFQAPRSGDLAACHREGVVPQSSVAEPVFGRLAEAQLKGERGGPVVGAGGVVGGGRQRGGLLLFLFLFGGAGDGGRAGGRSILKGIVNASALDNILLSPVQMAPWAVRRRWGRVASRLRYRTALRLSPT